MGGPATGRPFCLAIGNGKSCERPMMVEYSSLTLLLVLAAIALLVERAQG